jgi:hypothetical protein
MSSTVKEQIVVSELSKYGFKIGNEYVNYSTKLPEADKTKVVPGASFHAELFVSDAGKRYLNKILSSDTSVKAAAPVVDVDRAKKFVPKFSPAEKKATSETMTKADWSAKDRSQLLGGLCHDAATLAAAAITTGTSAEDVLKIFKATLDGVIELRTEVK